MKKSLTQIANFHGTDKGTLGPSDEWSAHNYTDVYEAYFEKDRDSPITMLEIGLGVTGENWRADIVHGKNTGGASIKMWYDYFENARIYGLDINECAYLNNDRITTYVADQGNIEDLERFMIESGIKEFDFIIDDGSHIPEHQQVSFGYFFKKLKKGGIYIIEDLLSNGKGDNVKGRMSSNTVNNTREVLKSYFNTGNFSTPNALIDENYLKDNIASVRFHVPFKTINYVLRRSITRPIGKTFSYKHNSEKVCVIRKK